MRIVFERNISESFVLDEERIRSLANALKHYAGEPSISVKCADDATRSFENVEELFEYENSRNGRITSLDMDSAADGWKKTPAANIKFAAPVWSAGAIDIQVSGLEEKALIAIRKLVEITAGSRAWHSRISKGPVPPFGWVGSIIFSILVSGFIRTTFFRLSPAAVTEGSELGLLLLPTWAGLISVLVVRYVTKILFPAAVFLIGQEKGRHATKQWQQKLALGALVTTAVGVILRLLFMS